MPYQIKNGIVYGSNAISLTQAQYDALSEAEKKNGTVYYIYDSDSVMNASDVELGEGTVEDLAGSVATIETSPTVTNHVVGEHILWNGQLYEVISAIGVGADLTVNTNISATSVGEELTTLKNGLNGLNFRLYTGVQFSFSNSQYAVVNISTIDSNLSNARFIAIFNSVDAVPILANLNSAKTAIQATLLSATTATKTTNILAIY